MIRNVQRAVIKDTKATVQTEAIAPRVAQNQVDLGSVTKIRVRIHPQHELELNENVEEPWTCVGDGEIDGCQSDDPNFLPGMGARYTCHTCIYYLCEACAQHYKS